MTATTQRTRRTGNFVGNRAALLSEAAEIRARRDAGASPDELAALYQVSRRTIYRMLETPRFACRDCGRVFARRSSLVAHALGELADAPAPREVAGALPDVPADAGDHIRRELLRRNMRPGFLSSQAGVPLDILVLVMRKRACPTPAAWRRIIGIIGSPALHVVRDDWHEAPIARARVVAPPPPVTMRRVPMGYAS